MRRAVADSDDEDEDLAVGFYDHSAETALPVAEQTTDGEATVSTFDGTIERSTGSTEQLRRAIESAERGLVSHSTSREMTTIAPSASASPSMQANKRRHTAALGSDANAGQEKGVKRTKTSRIYATKRQTRVTDDGSFERVNDDEAAPATSQSAKFTEHSEGNSEAPMPSGSIQDGFLGHEPKVMFRDSGSTVADNSSAEQRLLEEALKSNKGLTTSVINGLKLDEQQSSSFPWSPSGQCDTAKSSGPDAEPRSEPNDGQDGRQGGNTEVGTDAPKSSNLQQDGASGDLAIEAPLASFAYKTLRSPVVEIPRNEREPSELAQEAPASTEKPTKGRKRNAEEDDNTDPLNSDDKAIGLPKERYKPRPTKRRATQVEEEPIDFSVRPEKAARVKRNKTTDAVMSHATFNPDPDGSIARAIVARLGTDAPTKSGSKDPVQASQPTFEEPMTVQNHSQGSGNGAEIQEEPIQRKLPEQATVSLSVEHQTSDDAIFVKPAKPTPKTKTYSKARRSQTTIFEDHVEFKGSQRSPSLNQQQATRNSALGVVQNEAKSSIRKRKVVVEDEEDEGDEPAQDVDADREEDSESKKRARGRPAKSTTKEQPKSEEKVLEDPEDDADQQTESEKATKKRGRGRPSKSSDAPQMAEVEEGASKEPSGVQLTDANAHKEASDTRDTDEPADADGPTSSIVAVSNIPTPSPEKHAAPQKTTKRSPTSHSPIKSSLSVPLRVGLSRSHRIPSLLRMVKPPKR